MSGKTRDGSDEEENGSGGVKMKAAGYQNSLVESGAVDREHRLEDGAMTGDPGRVAGEEPLLPINAVATGEEPFKIVMAIAGS